MTMYGRMFSIGRNPDYDRGLRLFDQGLYEAAIPELEKVMETSESDNMILVKLASFYLSECWSYLGSYAIGQRLFDRAAHCYIEALKRNPGYADLHCKLSAVYYMQDKPDAALTEINNALAINPRYAKALVQAGLCQYRLVQPAIAIKLVEQAVECDPELDNSQYRRGLADHSDGDYTSALSAFSFLVVNDVDDVAYHARLGSDFFRRGMLDEASEEFELALDINPDYADLHNSLGTIYYSAGKYQLAIAEFKKALEINPNYIEAKYNLEVSTHAVDRSGSASVSLRLIVDDSSDNSSAAL